MRKQNFIASIIMLVSVVILLSGIVFAWIISTFKSDPILIESGTVTMESSFYQGVDSNKDGTLDDGTYTVITEAGLDFGAVIPGEVYSYKIVVENTGSITGYLSIDIKDIIPSDPALFNLLSIRYLDPNTNLESEINLSTTNVSLFEDYEMASDAIYDFLFQIYVKPSLDYTIQGESIIITQFELTLNQIENQ